jgi:hypothetical protein
LAPEFVTSGRLGVAFGSTHGSPTVQREIYKTFFSGFHLAGKSHNDAEHPPGAALESLSHLRHSLILDVVAMCTLVGVHKSEIIDILSRPALLITNQSEGLGDLVRSLSTEGNAHILIANSFEHLGHL